MIRPISRPMTKSSFWSTVWCFLMNNTGLLIICPLPGATILKVGFGRILNASFDRIIPKTLKKAIITNFALLAFQWDVMWLPKACPRMPASFLKSTDKLQLFIFSITSTSQFITTREKVSLYAKLRHSVYVYDLFCIYYSVESVYYAEKLLNREGAVYI